MENCKYDPVRLGLGKYHLSEKHPFQLAAVYHDASWDALKIHIGQKNKDCLPEVPFYYRLVVGNETERLLATIKLCKNTRQGIKVFKKDSDDIFFNVCKNIARERRSISLFLQAYTFYAIVRGYSIYTS